MENIYLFSIFTEKTGICFPANLIRAYGEFFYGKQNYVFKENRKMFSLKFITKKTEICFLGNCFPFYTEKTGICFPANLIRAYREFFYGKHNYVFKENRTMFL
jgi:hypothetical protein